MDVDKLQRINNLARELMKHGMAGSMDEAVRIAEEKIQGAPEVSALKDGVSEDMLSQSQVSQSIENPAPAPQVQDDMDMRKIKNALDEQARHMSVMSEKINELISEFNSLQQEINRLKTIQVPAKPEEQKTGTQTQFRPQQEEKKEPHAKVGDYKPDDVAVDKIFYYGVR
ncbi:hypothetical protein ACFL96_07970 [Thermoproteota archaeon]